MCLEFLVWFIEQAKGNNCDGIVFLGDWHHSQIRIGSSTLNYSYKGLQLLNDCGLPVIFLIGNHDLMMKDSREIHSIPFASAFENIHVVNDTVVQGKNAFVPWVMSADDLIAAKADTVEYVFGHFEFPGFYMNEAYIMPGKSTSIYAEEFSTPKFVFSGHYHKRQQQQIKNTAVIYIGNPFPHDFSDSGDRDRGMAILDTSTDTVEYVNWPGIPTYDRVSLTQLLANPELFNSRSTIKVIPDAELTPDEIDEIRLTLDEGFGIKKVFFEPVATGQALNEVDLSQQIDGREPTVDERVVMFLAAQNWDKIGSTTERMIEAYLNAEVIV